MIWIDVARIANAFVQNPTRDENPQIAYDVDPNRLPVESEMKLVVVVVAAADDVAGSKRRPPPTNTRPYNNLCLYRWQYRPRWVYWRPMWLHLSPYLDDSLCSVKVHDFQF